MSNGFSLIEVLIALTLCLGILTIVIANVTETSSVSKKIMNSQEVMESIFHTANTIKSDLTNCGMRLQEADSCFELKLFECTDSSFKVLYGLSSGRLDADAFKGDSTIQVQRDDYFKRRKRVLLYNLDSRAYEMNEIKETEKDRITLLNRLEHDYFKNSVIVVLKEVAYKLYDQQNTLKRKTDSGYFQPLIENVTEFSVNFFPEAYSVLYRIEVNKKEQIRGYVFLTNMVK